jgi:nucleotide-binding universal stress UspA family protein
MPEENFPDDILHGFPVWIRRILVPTDFSPACSSALRHAVPIAALFKAKITLLYVSPAQLVGTEFAHLPGEEESVTVTSVGQLREIAEEKVPANLLGELLVSQGVAFEEINQIAREHRIDLIVIHTRGNTGMRRALLGSTTEHVVRTAPCPVLVVRD